MRNGSITDGSLCNSAKHANQAALLWKFPPPLSLRLRSLFQPWSRQFFSTPIPRIDQTLVNLHPSRCVRGRWFEGHINSRAACFSLHAHTRARTHTDNSSRGSLPCFLRFLPRRDPLDHFSPLPCRISKRADAGQRR